MGRTIISFLALVLFSIQVVVLRNQIQLVVHPEIGLVLTALRLVLPKRVLSLPKNIWTCYVCITRGKPNIWIVILGL